jgi:NAD(P)-dependent dehydrogenase (short-subunit alcohol dehydrogenase family)
VFTATSDREPFVRVAYGQGMQISLDGKVALVTGASRGIGKAMAATMAAAGAKVMLNSRKQDALEATATEIREAADGDVDIDVFAANAGDEDAGERAVLATIERFGALDILVNNAATNPYYGATLGVDRPRYDKTFQVNLDAPIFWSKAAHEHAFAERPGVIINVASVGGLRAEFGLGVYNLTKAALIHFTRQLACEIGPTRVVGIAPGLVQTDFAAHLVDNFGDTLAARLPTKRLGVPQDIANLATFLASDAASWITGETYVIDGGAGVAGSAGDGS